MKINDGYEDYAFNQKCFNEKVIFSLDKSGSKLGKVSFNFKLIHKDIYTKNRKAITFSNPGIFIIDSDTAIMEEQNIHQICLPNLTDQQIIEIIGEK